MYSTDEPNTYMFRCSNSACRGKTFSRWYDLRRHYNGAHAIMPIVYWCEDEGCSRSEPAGDRPFPRKDKLADHVEKIHGASRRT
jgi:hypothetical protein